MAEPRGKQRQQSSACPLVSRTESRAVKQVHHTARAERASLSNPRCRLSISPPPRWRQIDQALLGALNTWGFYTLMSFTWQMTCVYKVHLAGRSTCRAASGAEPWESGPGFTENEGKKLGGEEGLMERGYSRGRCWWCDSRAGCCGQISEWTKQKGLQLPENHYS